MAQISLSDRSDALLEALERAARDHAPASFSSSLSAEDMVITDAILKAGLSVEIFTLDTGRLHGDTLEVIEAIRRRYGQAVRVYKPDPAAVARYVAQHGRD